jgi:predicted amidophosphoribosyltransferase
MPSARARPLLAPGAWLERVAGVLAGLGTCPACGAAPATATGLCYCCGQRAWTARRDGDVLALGAYAGELGRLVRAAKFGGAARILDLLGDALGRGLAQAASGDAHLARAWLVPIPSHPRRRARRGADPSERLARAAAAACPATRVVTALRRVRDDPPQSSLSAAQRAGNVSGAFTVAPRWARRLRGHTLVLVDDVLTSGATVRAAATPLTAAGAEVVLVLVIAGPGAG